MTTRLLRRRRALAVTAFAVLLVGLLGVGGASALTRADSGSQSLAMSAAANPAGNLDQCANGPTGGTSCTEWVNGNLGASKSMYSEGDSVAYRLRLSDLTLNTHEYTVQIQWDTTESGKHALDYLTSYNRTITAANACDGVTGCSSYSVDTEPIPLDPNLGITPAGGVMTLFGGTITHIGPYTLDGAYSGSSKTSLVIKFTASVATPVLAWGGHIATRADWGMTGSAIAISGSPYHMRFLDLDGQGGNQDRSLSADAVIFPGSITIIKQASPEGSTSFPFTASPAPLTAFSLVDPSDNTKVFSNIQTFGTYTVGETVPSGWTLNGINCSVTSDNGGSFNVTLPSVAIAMKEGENWTCTFTDQQQTGTLIVKKLVTNDDGGTAVPSNWSIHVKSGGSDVSSSPQAGNGTTGTSYTLPVGAYAASETGGPSGYTGPVFGGDCDSSGNVTVAYNATKTCTLTNNDVAPQLKLVKSVTNDDGGTAVANDWNLAAAAASPNDGRNFNNAGGSGTFHNVFAGASYTLSESGGPSAYSSSGEWSCTGGSLNAAKTAVTLAVGDQVTCTIVNNDNAPQLKLVKSVVNNDGGTAGSADWTLAAAAGSPNDGRNFTSASAAPAFHNVLAGVSYALSESGGPAGYSSTGEWSCDGGSLNAAKNAVTVPLGAQVTCTIVNTDDTPQLKLVKSVVNDNGGTAVADNWTLAAAAATPNDGRNFNNAGGSGTFHNVFAGASYALSESGGPSGYTSNGQWTCDGGTLNAAKNAVTVPLGAQVTCTITNTDNAPQLKLVKDVVNNDGGTAAADDWLLAAAAASPKDGRNFSNAGGSGTFHNVYAGAGYVLSETGGPVGYSSSGEWSCDGGTLNAAKNAVTLALGAQVTCTITNTDNTPKLKLVKSVVNNDGGTAGAADWTLSASGTPSGRDFTSATATPVFHDVFAGVEYALAESSGPAGYSTTSEWSCDGGTLNAAKNAVTVPLGAQVTCTIVNTDDTPKLKLVKSVINDNGGTAVANDWTLSATAASPNNGRNFNNAGGSGTFQNVFAGVEYSLSEAAGPSGYSTSGEWSCVGGTLNAAKNAVTVALGAEVTCTITNDDQPGHIIVKKETKPSGALDSFNFDATGTGYVDFALKDGEQNNQTLDAGSYTVRELVPAGWVLTGLACNVTGGGASSGAGDLATQTATISLKVGDTVTCTFQNTGQMTTRTQGFWATHPELAWAAWNGGSAGGHDFGSGVAGVAAIGDRTLCGIAIDSQAKLMSGFWSNISKTSTGAKRSGLGQSKMQLLQQLLAAELNASAFGSAPSAGSFSAWETALCGTNANAVKTAAQQAASFNTAGDSGVWTPGMSADAKSARSLADQAATLWDVFA